MTGESANFKDALNSGRISTASFWLGPSLDWRSPQRSLMGFLCSNSLSKIIKVIWVGSYIRIYVYKAQVINTYLNGQQYVSKSEKINRLLDIYDQVFMEFLINSIFDSMLCEFCKILVSFLFIENIIYSHK